MRGLVLAFSLGYWLDCMATVVCTRGCIPFARHLSEKKRVIESSFLFRFHFHPLLSPHHRIITPYQKNCDCHFAARRLQKKKKERCLDVLRFIFRAADVDLFTDISRQYIHELRERGVARGSCKREDLRRGIAKEAFDLQTRAGGKDEDVSPTASIQDVRLISLTRRMRHLRRYDKEKKRKR